MRTLFDNEAVITEAKDKSVVLTNKRIWKEDSSGGKSFYQSITLPQISSVQCLTEEFIILLIIGVMVAGIAIYLGLSNQLQQAVLAGIVSAIFIVMYFATKGSTVIVASSSAKLKLSIKGMNKEKVMLFIDKIENAIENYNK